MWQRRGNKAPTISHPMQFTQLDQDMGYDRRYDDRYDDGYDERYLETIPEVDSISSRRQSAHVALPELPFRSVPPMTDIPQPVNLIPKQPASVVNPRDQRLRINVHLNAQNPTKDDVSPLTPQEARARLPSRDEQPVSPIENAALPRSRIPIPDRSFPTQIPRKKVAAPARKDTKETKWDEYSGEPTNDEKGKAASVRPGAQPLEMQYPHLKERTKMILAGLRERDAANRVAWGKQPAPVAADPLDEPVQRAPWKGASGRAVIVEPVKNTPSARQGPLVASEKMDRYPDPVDSPIGQLDSNKSSPTEEQTGFDPLRPYSPETTMSPTNGAPLPAYYAATTTNTSHSPQLRSFSSQEEIKPVAPLKMGKRIRTPELVTKPLAQSPEPQSLSNSPEQFFPPQNTSYAAQDVRVESPQYDEEPTTPTTPVVVETPKVVHKTETPPAYDPHDLDREQSRFSWTTYATSAAESPRSMAQVVRSSSPPPPIPELGPVITIKKRPVSSSPFMHSSPYSYRSYADSNASVIRKPLPYGNRTSSLNTATSRAASTSKSLPPTPTVLEASDKIENFEAQLESLERRKHNINRIITGLDSSLKKNAVVYDMWKRKEVEKNITNHKLELDEITSEIHDISLQLHRAQRKRDRDDNYEACTGLWIKRVTS